MNKVIFMREPKGRAQLNIILILILIAATVVPLGIIFDSSWLSWTGLALIGVACLWLGIEAWRALFLPWPRYRLARVNSKPMADEFLRVGWTLREERPRSGDHESREYLFEWMRDGDPAPPDLSKLSERPKG